MATAIINGLNATSHDIIISGSSLPRSREIAEQLGVKAALSHQELIDQSDLVILVSNHKCLNQSLLDFTSTSPFFQWRQG